MSGAAMKKAVPARVSGCDDFDIGDLLLTVLQVEGRFAPGKPSSGWFSAKSARPVAGPGRGQLVVRTPASNLWPVKSVANVFVGPGTADALRACAAHLDGLNLQERVA